MIQNLPYVISGTVVYGKQLGRKLGMPTANIFPREDIGGLDKGVYCSKITLDGKEYRAVTNLGIRPTVEDGEVVNAETYIIDFEGNLYGKTIEITLVKFVRGEKRFDSLQELKQAIKADILLASSMK